jgi:uncharacterized protein (TIRG00374 family)
MDGDRLTTAVGFLAALLVLSAVVWVVGVDDVLGALSAADPSLLWLVVVTAAVWLVLWGLALWLVLGTIGAPISPVSAVVVFVGAIFSNNVTPFGQAGGEPVSALLISTVADSEYETGLAAIASVDTLHFLPSIGLAIVGFGYVLASAAELTRNILVAALGVAVLATVIPLGAYLGWRRRERVQVLIVRVVTPVARLVGRVLPGRSAPAVGRVEARLDGFFEALGRVAGDRRTVVAAMGCSALGWIALSTALWFSFYALGYVVPFAATLFVVPVGSIAGVTPLPGGLGSLDAVFIALLIPTAGVPASTATAGVLIYRGATYWLPTLVGGGIATVIGARRRRLRAE